MNAGRIEQVGTPEQVYHHPASSFVYNFLGNVNLFHGRVDNGTTHIDREATGHLVFVRPHDLDIARRSAGANSLRVTVKHINAAGPVVKVEAATEWGAPVHVELTQQRFADLALQKGEQIFITPRDLAVFADGRRVS
jgi:sulfate transport system ATP-binding protein